jgi:transcription initiation factor IIE alpha subunit
MWLDTFKRRVGAKLRDGPKVFTDEELAQIGGCSVRSAQRYLKHFKQREIFRVERQRHHHYKGNWINERKIFLTEEALLIAEAQDWRE